VRTDGTVRTAPADLQAGAPVAAGAADPFSLADPAITRGILTEAGFIQVAFTEVHEPVYYGPDSATAYDAVLGLQFVKDRLAELDASAADHALRRLRTTLAAHETDDGVLFDSRAWIVTARRPTHTASHDLPTRCEPVGA
jgi:hypothetical protein